MKKSLGVYVHIPFCKSKCYYCDFISYENKENLEEEYVNSLIEEIKEAKLEQYNIKTVYIGGGTPSILQSKNIEKILKQINPSKEAEITIEVNPGTVCKEKLKDYKNYRINRLSIGLQSTDNNILKQIRKNTHI